MDVEGGVIKGGGSDSLARVLGARFGVVVRSDEEVEKDLEKMVTGFFGGAGRTIGA